MDIRRQQEILTSVCNLPTAPFCEGAVVEWLLRWGAERGGAIRVRRDRAGNVYLEYRRGRKSKTPLVVEAHMDHPGFIVTRRRRDGEVEAIFRGGVKPSHFKGARVRFWLPEGGWSGAARVREVRTVRGARHLRVRLGRVRERLPAGMLGMWDLPEAEVRRGPGGGIFAARVCDDLAGVAAMVCMLEGLIAEKMDAHVIGLCSRAEEVGFAGVLAVCERGWVPRGSPVIGIETSKASAYAPQGSGPIIRVGDRTGIFSAGLTHFVTQTAGHIADEDSSFGYARKLMDGGTCNSTAFLAYGYDAAGVCLALGNYHNMSVRGEVGYAAPGAKWPPRAGKGIAAETIHLGDFLGLVRLLTEAARRIGEYEPGMGVVRRRLAKMHREEQVGLLYANSSGGRRR